MMKLDDGAHTSSVSVTSPNFSSDRISDDLFSSSPSSLYTLISSVDARSSEHSTEQACGMTTLRYVISASDDDDVVLAALICVVSVAGALAASTSTSEDAHARAASCSARAASAVCCVIYIAF